MIFRLIEEVEEIEDSVRKLEDKVNSIQTSIFKN